MSVIDLVTRKEDCNAAACLPALAPPDCFPPAMAVPPSAPEGLSRFQKYRRKQHLTHAGSAKLCLKGAKERAKKLGIPFDLSLDDLELPTLCMFTKRPLKYGAHNDWDAASLDRIRPELGYVKGNVRVISRLANMVRFNCTDPDVFRALADDAERIRAEALA